MRRVQLAACCLLLTAAAGLVMAQSVPPTIQVAPAPPSVPGGISYADITEPSGLAAFQHVSGDAAKDYIVEVTGSGVALWDYDGDGLPDIYLLNGSTLDHLRKGRPAPRAALFRNNGNRTFTDVTQAAGVGNERWGQGVCAGDIDNDGRSDIYVTNFGKNRLYRQVEPGRFEDVAEQAGVAVDSWTTGCAFGDYDGDGLLDLFVAGYVTLDVENLPPAPRGPTPSAAASGPAGGTDQGGMGAAYKPGAAFCTYRGVPVMCGPLGLTGAPDLLFRNNGDGTFTDVTEQAGVTDRRGLYGFGVAWFDMDDDGHLDLIVSNDSGPNSVFRNLGNGRFEDVSYVSGAALDGSGRSQAHMGVAIGDFDNDGRNDIHITNFADDFNVLYHNEGGFFSDVSFRTGVARVSMPFLGWGTHFLDYDNDGWLDLLAVNGHVYPDADQHPWNTSYAQRALLLRNVNGRTFEDVGAASGPGLTTPRVSRGSAVGDIDNDGGIDIVISNLDGPPTLLVNEGKERRGGWLTVLLRGDPAQKTPRDAIGSVVFVTAGDRRVRGEVASGRGQISQSDLRVHLGLGDARTISKLEVRWANAETVSYMIPEINRVIVIDQAKGVVR